MKTKNILILGGITLGALALLGGKKYNDISSAISELKYKIIKIDQLNIMGGLNVAFNLDLQIYNPTAKSIYIPARISKLYFYLPNQNQYFGYAEKDIALDIPAETIVVEKDIRIVVNTIKAIEVASYIAENGYENIQIKADIKTPVKNIEGVGLKGFDILSMLGILRTLSLI